MLNCNKGRKGQLVPSRHGTGHGCWIQRHGYHDGGCGSWSGGGCRSWQWESNTNVSVGVTFGVPYILSLFCALTPGIESLNQLNMNHSILLD